MQKVLPIFRREMHAYFYSPVAYIVISVFLLITGWFFTGQMFLANDSSLRSVFDIIPFIFIFFVPAVTMRLLSEERKSGTIELMFTMPISDTEIILGKSLAGLGFLVVAILFTLPYAFSLMILGKPDLGMMMTSYIGLVLMGAAYVSIGVFASTISRNQVISFIIAFAIIFALTMLRQFLMVMPPYLVPVLQYLSIDYHYENISRGVLDSRNVIYYLSLVTFMLALARISLESRKWS